MKAIHAYLRRHMAGAVVDALTRRGCTEFSVLEVRGVTAGLRREEYDFSVQLGLAFEPIVKLEIVSADAQVTQLVEVIRVAGTTGQRGDGMIFVLPVEQAIRISTGSHGEEALKG